MTIQRIETNIIPATAEGQQFANLYENKLRDQGCFKERKDSTANIQITAEYFFDLGED